MGDVRDHAVVAELVVRRQREAGVVAVALHQVRFHRVEALVAAHVEPSFHQGAQDVHAADVQPAFAVPAVGAAQDGAGEGVPVGAVVLPGPHVDVTDHLPPVPVQSGHVGGAVLEAVDVVHRHVDGRVHLAVELPLPGEPGAGPPVRAGRGRTGGRAVRRGPGGRGPAGRGAGRAGRRRAAGRGSGRGGGAGPVGRAVAEGCVPGPPVSAPRPAPPVLPSSPPGRSGPGARP